MLNYQIDIKPGAWGMVNLKEGSDILYNVVVNYLCQNKEYTPKYCCKKSQNRLET